MEKWKFIYKGRYYYWKHVDGYYQCTNDKTEPLTESGYNNLLTLMQLKNESYVNFIEVRDNNIQ